jgi:uncharacterized membrane protein
MTRREISERHRQWLTAEMESWRTAGVLAADQPERILALYESPQDASARSHSSAMFALMSVAAFLIGLAALLLVGYNWEAMPKPAKLSVVFGVIAATHGIAFWLRYGRHSKRLSEAVFFLACLFYGCGIWLVAQIFNIQGHYPNALWIWALGTIPFALCLDTLLLHALVAGLLATWVGTEILDFGFGWGFWRIPDACYSLPLLALPGLLWAYRKRSPATVGLYTAVLAWWVILQPIAWNSDVNPIYFIGAAGALFLAIAECHGAASLMSAPYRLYGVLLSAGVLCVLSFGDFIGELLHGPVPVIGTSVLAAALIGVGGTAAIAIAERLRLKAEDNAASQPFLVRLFRRQWPAMMVMLLMAALALWVGLLKTPSPTYGYYANQLSSWTAAVIVPTVVCNLALIALAIWLIRSGLNRNRGKLFAAGVFLFLLWAVCRYIDLFAGVGGMLGASLMFFLCGTALFAMARFWSHRKEMVHV